MTTPPPDQERAEQATVMTEIKELVARLREDARQMWNTGLVPKGSTPLAEQAASTIELLSSQVEDLKAALGETLAILEGPTPPAAEMFAAMDLARSALSQSGKE